MRQRSPGIRALLRISAAVIYFAACSSGSDDQGQADFLVPPDRPPSISGSHPAEEITPSSTQSTTGSGDSDRQTPRESDSAETVGDGDDLLALVDKLHALPADYEPPDLSAIPSRLNAPGFGGQALRDEAVDALISMLDAGDERGQVVRVRSAYRSYLEQRQTFQQWVSVYGEAEAERISAHAGHSEHQLGTAADLTSASAGWELEESFGSTDEGRWLADHAHEYGFALSYPEGAEDVTGYRYEPWHYRYIGREAAAEWWASGLTLREFLASR